MADAKNVDHLKTASSDGDIGRRVSEAFPDSSDTDDPSVKTSPVKLESVSKNDETGDSKDTSESVPHLLGLGAVSAGKMEHMHKNTFLLWASGDDETVDSNNTPESPPPNSGLDPLPTRTIEHIDRETFSRWVRGEKVDATSSTTGIKSGEKDSRLTTCNDVKESSDCMMAADCEKKEESDASMKKVNGLLDIFDTSWQLDEVDGEVWLSRTSQRRTSICVPEENEELQSKKPPATPNTQDALEEKDAQSDAKKKVLEESVTKKEAFKACDAESFDDLVALEESDAIAAIAVQNFEVFHSLPSGSANIRMVEESSAGVVGWAAFASAPHEALSTSDRRGVTCDPQGPGTVDGNAGVSRATDTATASRRRLCDDSEATQLQEELLLSLGVSPASRYVVGIDRVAVNPCEAHKACTSTYNYLSSNDKKEAPESDEDYEYSNEEEEEDYEYSDEEEEEEGDYECSDEEEEEEYEADNAPNEGQQEDISCIVESSPSLDMRLAQDLLLHRSISSVSGGDVSEVKCEEDVTTSSEASSGVLVDGCTESDSSETSFVMVRRS